MEIKGSTALVTGANRSLDEPNRPTRPPIVHWEDKPRVELGPLSAESPMNDMESSIWQSLHAFAEKTMRPVGRVLDRMQSREQLEQASPYWEFFSRFKELGISVAQLMDMELAARARLLCIANEEFGWGDGGLAIVIGATMLPHVMMHYFGKQDLTRRFPEGVPGCWAITEPDHGTDSLDPTKQIFHPQGSYGRPICVATLRGDTVVLDGQKSAWCSNAPAAQICVLYCAADRGQGAGPENGICIIVPLDAPAFRKARSYPSSDSGLCLKGRSSSRM